jgi:addiction module HigA family antidote
MRAAAQSQDLAALRVHCPQPFRAIRFARRRNVTAEMALRLARCLWTSAQVWRNLQAQYDLEVAITKIGKVVKQKIRPRSNPAPIRRSAAA